MVAGISAGLFGETGADNHIRMAELLANGLNLGLTRMAEACRIGSLGQLAWTSDWHIRDETFALQPGQPSAARTVCRALRQQHGIIIGRPVLPGCRRSILLEVASPRAQFRPESVAKPP
jgi:hypothetical protein